jgi:hypothetical protein
LLVLKPTLDIIYKMTDPAEVDVRETEINYMARANEDSGISLQKLKILRQTSLGARPQAVPQTSRAPIIMPGLRKGMPFPNPLAKKGLIRALMPQHKFGIGTSRLPAYK